jgi:HEAT repeat protein
MKRPDPVETALNALRAADDVTPFLRHRNHRVVAKAAERTSRLAAGAAPELVDAFRRFLQDPVKQDPGCVAKLAIARALVELDDPAAEVYFAGARHVQLEPVWGDTVDSAAELRGICAIGLARMAHPEALLEAVRLLNDKCPETRIGALRALSDSGKAEAELVLRFKADMGDKRPEVEAECFAALLRLGPRSRAIPFVAEFLKQGNAEAAIALGESRSAEAWPVLRDAFATSPIQSEILLALALLRNDAAIEFLFERVAGDRERVGAVAIEALASYRGDESLRARMEQLVLSKNAAALRKAFETHWR